MTSKLATALILGGLFLAPTAAFATTEAECQSAINETSQMMERDAGFQSMPEGRQEEVQSIMAQAGEALDQGDYDKCMEHVESAKGAAGLR